MQSVGSERKFPFAAALNTAGFLGAILFILIYIDPPVIYSNNGFDLYNWVQVVHLKDRSPDRADYPGTSPYSIYNMELTGPFFRKACSRPGGFAYLAVCTITAACHFSLPGAAAILLVSLLLFWAFPLYIKNSGGPALLINRWLPGVFVILSCCRYDLYWVNYCIAVTGALILTIAYQKISRNSGAAIAVFFALFWLSYYLFQWSSLLFVMFVFLHTVWTRPQRVAPLGIIAAVALTGFFVMENRILPVEDAIRWKEFIARPLPPLAVICYFPLITLGVRLQIPWIPRNTRQRTGFVLIRSALLLLIIGGAMFRSISDPVMRDTRAIGRTMHHMLNGKWETILREDASPILRNKSATLLQVLMVNVVDHALCKTGRLGDAMFSYPQSLYFPESLLLLRSTHTGGFANWIAALELQMDLGGASMAERISGELMENMGPYPFLLERRALIQAAKGNDEAAAVYCHRLSGMPFYHGKAESLLVMIGNETIKYNDRVAHLVACMDTSDYLLFHLPDDSILGNLLRRNPSNRMAWEYLIAYYLQTGQPSKILGEIGRYREFGYEQLPFDWDQALCISLRENPSLNANQMPAVPQDETVARYDRILSACALYRDSLPNAAMAALAPSFGSTYFFFYLFGFTPGSVR